MVGCPLAAAAAGVSAASMAEGRVVQQAMTILLEREGASPHQVAPLGVKMLKAQVVTGEVMAQVAAAVGPGMATLAARACAVGSEVAQAGHGSGPAQLYLAAMALVQEPEPACLQAWVCRADRQQGLVPRCWKVRPQGH